MAKICAVCNKKISFFWEAQPQPKVYTHPDCEARFLQSPERYGGKAIEDPVQDARYQTIKNILKAFTIVIALIFLWIVMLDTIYRWDCQSYPEDEQTMECNQIVD